MVFPVIVPVAFSGLAWKIVPILQFVKVISALPKMAEPWPAIQILGIVAPSA